MTEREEQLARVVHGAVAFGATADEALHLSGGSRAVLGLALTYVDQRESTPVAWLEVIRVLRAAIALLPDDDEM